jgi:hypothetical protein
MNTLLLTLCVAVLPQGPEKAPVARPAAARQQPNSLEVLSLQALLHPHDGPLPVPFGTLLEKNDSPTDFVPRGEDGLVRQFDAEQVLGLLRGMHPESERGLLELNQQGESLFVRGPAESVTALQSELAQFEAIVAQPIVLEGSLYEWTEAEPPPATAGPEQLKKIVADRKLLWSSSASTRSNEPTALSRERWTQYLRTNEVEVAEKSVASQPVVRACFEGIRMVATPHALAASQDLVVYLQFAIGRQRRPTRLQPTGVKEQAAIDQPFLDSCFGACCARVPPGGAMLATLSGQDAGGCRVLLVLAPHYANPPTNAVVPISALTSRALQMHLLPPPPSPVYPGEDYGFQHSDNDSEYYGSLEADTLTAMLHSAVGEALEAEGNHMDVAGGWILLKSDADTRTRVEQTLTALQDRLLVNVDTQIEARLADSSGSDVFAPTLAAAGAALHCIRLPGLYGREVACFHGIETTAIAGFSPVIASGSAGQVPWVTTLRDGIWFSSIATPSQGALAANLLAQTMQQREPTQRALESQGNLQLPRWDSCRVVHAGLVTAGRDFALGDGPAVVIEGKEYRSILQARLTRK